MDSNSLFVIVDGMVMLCGIYVVYLYIVMVTTGKLTQNVLMPKDINIKKCKDVRGFIKYMGWKQLLFGVIAIICGGLGIVQDYMNAIHPVLYLGSIAVFVIYAVWYSMNIKKAVEIFW